MYGRPLEGDQVPGRPARMFFMGCLACRWLESRIDVVEVCPGGHRARRMEVKYTCNICRWVEWCEGPVVCSTSRSHELSAGDARLHEVS